MQAILLFSLRAGKGRHVRLTVIRMPFTRFGNHRVGLRESTGRLPRRSGGCRHLPGLGPSSPNRACRGPLHLPEEAMPASIGVKGIVPLLDLCGGRVLDEFQVCHKARGFTGSGFTPHMFVCMPALRAAFHSGFGDRSSFWSAAPERCQENKGQPARGVMAIGGPERKAHGFKADSSKGLRKAAFDDEQANLWRSMSDQCAITPS